MDRASDSPGKPHDADRATSINRVQLQAIFDHALRGAHSVGARSEVAREAAEIALGKFEIHMVSGRAPDRPERWAFRVGQNEALMLRRSRRCFRSLDDLTADVASCRPPSDARAPTVSERLEEFLSLARTHRGALTPRQREVVSGIQSDQSLKANARGLGLEPCNLRRMLRSIARRALRAARQTRCSEP